MGLPRLILASASPRRQSLLSEAGYRFVVHPADLDERSFEAPGLLPAELAVRLAVAKAKAVAGTFPDAVVLAADTVVALGDRALGKPTDADDAQRMLESLAGTTHWVITGVAVARPGWAEPAVECVKSCVQMRPLTAGRIREYVATRAWEGKAGGYGIQDSDPFVERMTGCLTNIVGLPMTTAGRMLEEAGIRAGG